MKYLSALNQWMENIPSWEVTDQDMMVFDLLDALQPRINKSEFRGLNIEEKIKTSRPFTAKPHYYDRDIPVGGTTAFVTATIPLAEFIANATLSSQEIDRAATGPPGSWGDIVREALNDLELDWKWLMEVNLMGHGNGAIARAVSAAHAAGVTTITCDNTYADFGWENVALLKTGMIIEIYAANLTTQRAGVGGVTTWTVTGVTFGDRNNGAATTGTFTLAESAGTLQATIADNDVIFIRDARTGAVSEAAAVMPMGLMGMIQGNGDGFTGAADITTFQGLTRATYPCLQGRVYQAADFASGGADGTPDDWDLSVISDGFKDVARGGGRGKPDLILTSHELAQAIWRRNRADNSIQVNVRSTGEILQPAVGAQYAQTFLTPDGRNVPIKVVETIPENVLVAVTTDDLRWHMLGNFAFKRLRGGVWGKTEGDRKTNYEAPFGGYVQLSAKRCDNCFAIQDLLTNI